MRTVLVTGGAGFIGSHVVDALIGAGHDVTVVDDLSSGNRENLNPEATFHKLDICDRRLPSLIESEGIEWIVHHAAQIDVRVSVTDPQKDANTNVLGLLNLLQAAVAHGVKGVVFASSGGVVYGEPDRLPVEERYPKGPLSPYGVSKLASEYYLHYYHRVRKLPSISLRYGNAYGPRQDPHGEAGVVAIFAGQLLNEQTPTIFGDGEQQRDYVYVEDVARANLLALERLQGELPPPTSIDDFAYNIGTGEGTSVNELYGVLAEITGFPGGPGSAPKRTGELERIFLDASKARRELGWAPQVFLEEGLRKTVEYFQGRDGS